MIYRYYNSIIMISIDGIILPIFIVEFLFLSKTYRKKHISKWLFLVGHFLAMYGILSARYFWSKTHSKEGRNAKMREKENTNKEGKIGGQTEFWDDEIYIYQLK